MRSIPVRTAGYSFGFCILVLDWGLGWFCRVPMMEQCRPAVEARDTAKTTKRLTGSLLGIYDLLKKIFVYSLYWGFVITEM